MNGIDAQPVTGGDGEGHAASQLFVGLSSISSG
jgi:hypothetical protein